MNSGQLGVETSHLGFRVSAFLDSAGHARHVLSSRTSGTPGVAASLYESYLALKTDSHRSRSGTLYSVAGLYAWADSVGVDVDALLVGGLGLSASDVSRFSMWLRERLGGVKLADLTPEARSNHNQILHFCGQACVYFITQYGALDNRSIERVRHIEMLVRSQERLWKQKRIKKGRRRVAPNLSDDELRQIETFLLPKNRSADVGEAVAHRDYLIWRLVLEFGLRIGEVLAMRLQDCPGPGRHYLSIVRIEERGDGVVDPRGANAPRPKTLSRDLRQLWSKSNAFQQIGSYSTRYRRGCIKEHGRNVFRWMLPHPFLIVAKDGGPLSMSSAQDIACAIKAGTGIDFHWHLGRHAFFNRMYSLSMTNQELQDLIYWGGWESDKSLLIYSRRARADRARGVMRTENEKWAWMALN